MTWQSPTWLWGLLVLVPLALGLVSWLRGRRRAAALYADAAVLDVRRHQRPAVRLGASALALAAVAAGILGLARPSIAENRREERSTVVLALDVSNSMTKKDLLPNRLDAALDAARRFLEEAPEGTQVGLVTFADRISVVAAPTDELARVRSALDQISETREGTALGEAVVASLGALQGAGVLEPPPTSPEESPARVLVLTDGVNSIRKATTPSEAAERAAALRVPVYTILLGNDRGRPDQPTPTEALGNLAARTGGIYAQSTTAEDLRAVFADIGSVLAPVEGLRELTVYAAAAALGLLALAGALAVFSRPQQGALPPLSGGRLRHSRP